jgi:hypothetical protein
MASNDRIKLERIGKDLAGIGLWSNFLSYPYISLEEQRKTTKGVLHGVRSPGRELNPGPLKNKVASLTDRDV